MQSSRLWKELCLELEGVGQLGTSCVCVPMEGTCTLIAFARSSHPAHHTVSCHGPPRPCRMLRTAQRTGMQSTANVGFLRVSEFMW